MKAAKAAGPVLRLPLLGRLSQGMVRRYPKAAVVSAAVLLVLLVAGLGADVIRPLDTRSVDLDMALQGPSLAHPWAPTCWAGTF